jgi:membrane protein YqaA with SNARE-associated domain
MFDVSFFETYGLLGLFLLCFLSATILPLSSELVFLWFLNESTFSTSEVLFIASLGNCLGGFTNYLLGFFSNKFFKINKHGKAFNYAQKYGFLAAFFSWIPFIGDPMLLALGFLNAPFWKSMILMSIGKVLRYTLLLVFEL